MLEFSNPIPVVTPLGDGYAIYATNSGAYENDCWTVALCNGGQVRHFLTSDIKLYNNATFGIQKTPVNETIINPRSRIYSLAFN